MYVIGVAGQAQHGKDTLADHLQKLLNGPWFKEHADREYGVDILPMQHKHWERGAFAKGVKKVYSDNFGVDTGFIERWKVKDEIPPGFDMNVRKSLQFIGDGFRQIKSSIWIDLALRGDEPRIISDVRYINEFKRIHEEGGLNILVGRPDKLNDDPNPSEAQIKPYVEWCLRNYNIPVVRAPGDVANRPWLSNMPPHMEMFDIFIRNEKTLEEYYALIEEFVFPYVSVFDFKQR